VLDRNHRRGGFPPPIPFLGVHATACTEYTGGVCPTPAAMSEPVDPATIARRLAELRMEHRDLDAMIARVSTDPGADELAVKRMKKRKLKLKDMIALLESRLIPDLDA
jgi:hypothetical protein